MAKVKICGLTRKEDIEYVNKYSPDYAGFVFSKSRRRIDLNKGKELTSKLKPCIKKVGIFVNESLDFVENVSKSLKLDVIQFHGEEDKNYIDNFSDYTVWKAIKVKTKEDILNLNYEYVDGILLDSKIAGSGKTFDWKIASNLVLKCQLILAGGLNIDNVEDGILKFKPYVVDVSSGVESFGLKDENKIKSFIEKVRNIK
ncbi:phosphoribosylanthranilate isomerase [Clostridium algifaecis]|uniref:N-(5'-phosphoribosyl)anthranilate isomerase n=1 Tax=Clostridium algifaecis TaxID=1472040 RepID=A0ABS4KP28_9CLOT|nr:phosphoribosylanthranilate isomerase [Clostridium algifaecis]MBP2031801.1 phosphoribosylanthranilate isomerase [Clostridium algifaecis]